MSKIRFNKQPVPPVPPTDKSWIFVDDYDGHLKRLKDDGSLYDYETISSAITGITTTTNTTPTLLMQIPITSDGSFLCESRIIGRRSSGAGSAGDSANFIRHFRVKRISGVVTILNVQSTFTSKDNINYSLQIQVSGTNVLIYVIGVNSTTIQWNGETYKNDNI